MVRLSTEYDKELNSKIYYLRGDEAYARTTSTVLYLTGYSNQYIEGYEVGMSVTVLRDLGSGTITLKDGNVVLGVYDWDDTMNLQELDRFKFPWGVEHKLSAHYSGNEKSLSSHSKVKKVTYNLPAIFKTQISLTGSTTTVTSGGNVNITATLTVNGEVTSNCYSQNIHIYVDDTLKQTITTPSNSNVATTTLTGIADGKHTVTAVVDKSSTINGATKSYNLSVGYDIKWTEYSETAVIGATNTYKATVKDYLGTPISSVSAKLLPSNSTTAIATASTNSDGVVTFTTTNPQASMRIGYSGSYSETLNFTIISANNINITLSPYNTTSTGLKTTITATVRTTSGLMSNVPVMFYENGSYLGVENTNSKGQATYQYEGDGSGEKYFTASSGGITSSSVSLKDYIVLYEVTHKRYDKRWITRTNMNWFNNSTYTRLAWNSDSGTGFFVLPNFSSCTIEIVSKDEGYISTSKGNTPNQLGCDVSNGDTVKMIWRNSQCAIYKNNQLEDTRTYSYTDEIYVFFDDGYGSVGSFNIGDLSVLLE